MKKKLLALITNKEARKAELNTKAQTSDDVVELRGINVELERINTEIAELRSMADALPDDVTPPAVATPAASPTVPECRSAIPAGILNSLGTYGVGAAPAVQTQQRGGLTLDQVIGITDPVEQRQELFNLPEYRSAYLKRLQGRNLNDVESRAITTAAATGGAAVPTTTYDKIIEKIRQTSVLFPLISATYIPGNVVLPVANALNAAQWTTEANTLTTGDDSVSGVSLAGYTLAKYAPISIAAMVMTIDAFETYIVNQIGTQLAIAVENAILNGLGSSNNPPQPTGILTAGGVTWDATNSATFATSIGYDDLVGLRALLNSVYRPFAKIWLNRNTEAAIQKVKSSTGFPIFSQDPQNGFAPKILNIDYLVDEYMPDNTVIYGCPSYYYMNFSQAPVIEASKEAGFASATILYRGMLIADGKPALSEAFCKLTKA
jgi:HK97 family phage major capsid protein